MPDDRLPKKIFLWDKQNSNRNSWSFEVKSILNKCNLSQYFQENSTLGLGVKAFLGIVKERLTYIGSEKWKTSVNGMPKLRTYIKIKENYCQEPIINKTMSSKQRSVISKIRSGTFPIEIEIGRYRQKPISERLCKICNNRAVEDEMHFLIQCPAYSAERQTLLSTVEGKLNIHTQELDNEELLKLLLITPDTICDVANFLMEALDKRYRLT
ncbi:unnamed protein product [Mytilus edulis]|uniref:Reverse transcriptase zinc-binding domain-containing protein n=1 Tax=Mytilus edulis TaxID=6550 RepID=A0A8S3UQR4_MYTED|nr:unnamed protein product [Mytilus edulis]